MTSRRPFRSNRVSAYHLFFCAGALLTAVIAFPLFWGINCPLLPAYLVAINLTTVVLYGYDKRQSVIGGLRVPEKVLHAHALVGGTPGAYIGQRLFRHKTLKGGFRQWFLGIVIVHICIVGVAIYFYLNA